MNPRHKFNLGYLAFVFLCVLLIQGWIAYRTVATLEYSEFLGYLKDHKIAEMTVTESRIEGTFTIPVEGKEYFVTQRVEPGFATELEEAGVKFAGASDQTWLTTLLSWILPVLFFFGLWAIFFRKMAERQGMGGLINIGKSKAKVYVERDTGVTFEDVAGVDEAKAELKEIVSFLKDKEKYGRLGARIPKGVLLVGPPGTGKTLLARAVAGEAGVPFFSISGSEFVEMFVGVGAARVRDLFDQARKAAPCIIFIDELDALGRARSAMSGMGGGDEKEQTLNQLLSELDGFDPSVGIVLLAATNRPEILDAALLRAGRFDRQVVVDRPEHKGRLDILKVHTRKVKLASDVNLDDVAGITTGFTGADLANLVNEAAIIATRRGGDSVSEADMTAAVERIVAGSERKTRLHQPGRTKARRVSRVGSCVGRGVAAERRPGPQGLDHPSFHRGARLYDAAPDRGPVPDHLRRPQGSHGRASGGPRVGGHRLRRDFDWRVGRPREGHRHRPGMRDPFRDERRCRAGGSGTEAPAVAGRPSVREQQQGLFRGHRTGGGPRRPEADRRGLCAGQGDPDREFAPISMLARRCCWSARRSPLPISRRFGGRRAMAIRSPDGPGRSNGRRNDRACDRKQ